mgnify:CR=1 FL=1
MGFNYGYEKKKFDSRWKRLDAYAGPKRHLDRW